MTCRCGESRRARHSHTFRRTVSGVTFTAEATVEACAGCGELHVPAALVISFERAVAVELARRGPVSGETFRWIRKAAALDRVELAHLVGASVETIGAWEEERRSVDPAAWTLVAAIALDAHEGPRPLRSRIKRWRRGFEGTTAKVTLTLASPGTLGKVLELLASPLVDADVADALDVDRAALRAALEELSAAGIVRRMAASRDDGAHRWERTGEPAAALRAAEDAGFDLDAPLPRAKSGADGPAAVGRARSAPFAWRASTT